MPEMAGEVTLRSLVVFFGVAGLCVGALSLGLALGARRFAPAAVWFVSGIAVAAVCAIGYERLFLQPLVYQELDLRAAAFYLVAQIGLPSAVAVWLAVRRAARPQRAHILLDWLIVAAGFVVVVPLAMVVASLPDML